MPTFFISDLHLHISRPEITDRFIRFLENDAKQAKALYILGDFFEAWTGDDIFDPHYQQIEEALRIYTNTGIPTYFMHGNRDFLLGEQFANRTGCILISDPYLLELNRHRYILTHGDTLCTLDKKYLRFRRFVRSSIIQKIFLLLPVFWRKNIAMNLRKKSSKNKENTSHANMIYFDVTEEAVIELLVTFQAQILIHGHTHKPGIHSINVKNNKKAQRIVLGDWGPSESMILKIEDSNQELINLNLAN